jgi:ribonuclease P/MRP protein subunit RPP1
MRSFIDLHLINCSDNYETLVSTASRLGYSEVAINAPINNLKKIPEISIASRIDIEPRTGSELSNLLREAREKYEIVAVKCPTKEVSRKAAKDSRVDILLFPDDLFVRRQNSLDSQEAVLAAETGCAYEINATEIISIEKNRFSRLIQIIEREINVAHRFEIPVILSSGAISPLQQREPKSLMALTTLLDVSEEEAKKMISTTPAKLLNKNRKKLSTDFSSHEVRKKKNAG